MPGGAYRIGMRDGVEALGEFVEIDPPRRVVFRWGRTACLDRLAVRAAGG